MLKGNYAELPLSGKSRFFEIYSYNYNPRNIERFKKAGVYEESDLYALVNLVKVEIPINTRKIYVLKTYISDQGISDLWDFNDRATDYEEFGFIDLNNLVDFCNKRWGVTKSDFNKRHLTNIPR